MTYFRPASTLCKLCRSISLEEMRSDRMKRHQPNYLALKWSAMGGCRLCGFIWSALSQCVGPDGQSGHEVLAHVSEGYPGREISLTAWSYLDHVNICTSGEVPDTYVDGKSVDGIEDPTMHPDYQLALSGEIDIFSYPGKNFSLFIYS